PAIHSLSQIKQLDQLGRNQSRPTGYHLKIDSGMGRLGTRAQAPEILAALEETPYARLEGLMTHFASAADFTSSQTVEQQRYFQSVCDHLRRAGFNPANLHASSTNAIGYGLRNSWHGMVRAGHALYGYVSPPRGQGPPKLLDVKPALTWKAKLMAV